MGVVGGLFLVLSERIKSADGQGATLLGLAFGEAFCGVSAGWTPEQAGLFFKEQSGLLTEWPRRTRGLPVPVRRLLRRGGLHGIHTQTAMALAYEGPRSVDHAKVVGALVVAGFEASAWRNFPRGLMSMAHRQRVDCTSRLTNDVTVRPGPIGAAVSYLGVADPALRRALTVAALDSLYGDELTSFIGALLGEILAHCAHGDVPTLEGALDSLRLEPALVTLNPERLADLLMSGVGHLGQHVQVINALKTALSSNDAPLEVLRGILLEGVASDTAGAVAGSILAARAGTDWCDVSALLAGERLIACADWLNNGQEAAPETYPEFLEAESDLTRSEMAFRDEMMAERRTSSRLT